ncbi:MAG: EamA family transporter [Bacteroidales bacterium]|nr:EamA family transporter [Bacteroidales bacterium]MDZ4204266.1 EamA family transporter [Bacteroidales bacterium]
MTSRKTPDSNSATWLIISILAITWGSSFILMKRALVVFSSDEVGALRIVISFLFLLPFAIRRLPKITAKDAGNLALAGFLGNGVPAFLFAKAQTVIDSSVAGILNSLTPLFTVIVGLLAFKIQPRWFNVLGVLMGLAGAVGLVMVSSNGNYSFQFSYALLIVVATLFYAANTNIIKVWLKNIEPVGIVSLSFFIIGPPVLIYLLAFTDFTTQLANDPKVWSGLAYLAILSICGTALALMLFNKLLKMTTPLFASSITYLIPIVALLWGLLDGEKLGWSYALWVIMILSGIILVSSKHADTMPLVGFFIRKIKNNRRVL